MIVSTFQALAGGSLSELPDPPLLIWQDVIAGAERRIADLIHRHENFFSLYVVQQGRGTHVINGAAYAIARGDVYLMGLGATHWYLQCEGLISDTLHFAPSALDPAAIRAFAQAPEFGHLTRHEPLPWSGDQGGGTRWFHLNPTALMAITNELYELRAEWSRRDALGALLTRGLFLRLLTHLARHSAAEPSGRRSQFPLPLPSETRIATAVRYLEEHFTEPLRIEEVAARVCLSADWFTEVFAATMGRTPSDYLRHLRVEQAKRLLETTERPVGEIALEAGFGTSSYFSRVFHAATGTTAGGYRKRPRA